MPVVAKCPNCNGPLDKAPGGQQDKCPYCGATLLATRFMQAPQAPGAPGAPGGGPPGWGTPQGGFPPHGGAPHVGFPPPTGQPFPPFGTPAVTVVGRSMTMYVISSVFTLLIIGGAIAAAFWAQKETQQRVEQAQQAVTQATEARNAPIKLAARTLEPGKDVVFDLPGSGMNAMGHVVGTLNVELDEETPFEITMIGSEPYVSCRIKALDADAKALARSNENDTAQIYPVLPKGLSSVIVDCNSHPTERSVRVVARPAPVLEPGNPLMLTVEPGAEAAGAILVPDAPGLWVVTLQTEESSMSLQILGADDVLVGKQSVNASTDRGVVEAELPVAGYLVQALHSFRADNKLAATVTATRIDPEPIALGAEASGALTRWVPQRYYLLTLEAETKIVATLTGAFDHTVEIRRADGVSLASSDQARSGREAKVSPPEALAAGTYRIVVRGEEHDVSEGTFTLKVAEATEEPRRGGRRGVR